MFNKVLKMKFILNDYKKDLSDEEIIQDIKNTSERLQKDRISISEYRKYGKYSQSAIQGHFGTWINALKKAGLRTERTKSELKIISDKIIYEDLLNVAKKIKLRTVPYAEYKKHGKYSADYICTRFKKWNIALKNAGLEETGFSKDKITEQECFDEIERIWIFLGRQPTSTDLTKTNICKYCIDTFKRRFGSWRKALEAFVNYVNNDDIAVTEPQHEEKIIVDDDILKKNITKKLRQNKHTTSRNITTRLRFIVLQRDNFKCCACGASPAKDPSVVLHVDHIKPWAKGGETVLENLQTLCSKCNLGKSDIC